jgi:hypothetical protein
MKYLSFFFFTLFILFACKKDDEPKNLCTNGLKDIGETGVDCGGPCGVCPDNYFPYLSIKWNEKQIAFTNRSFTETDNKWSLKFWNDSIQVNIEIGELLFSDSLYDVTSVNTYATYFGVVYPFTSVYKSSNLAISELVIPDRRVSGFFETKFYRVGFTDTMRVTSGNFNDLPF